MAQETHTIVPIILAGGQGTRLWPASLPHFPKQFLKIGEKSLIEQAIERVLPLGDEILILTSQHYFDLFSQQALCSKQNAKRITLIGEPSSRNTAPAIALALHYVHKTYKNAIMLLITADHLIHPIEQFVEDAQVAIQHAKAGNIVTFGIPASKAETGYGYIECGENIGNEKEKAFKVLSFREKPDYDTARQYVESGNFFWNSGMFCFLAQSMYEEFSLYSKDLFSQIVCKNFVWHNSIVGGFATRIPDFQQFVELEKVSIDYAVMEHTKKAVVVPAQFVWNDVGSWDEVAQYIDEHTVEDSQTKQVYIRDAHNVSVHAKIPVAINGVSDIMVVYENNRLLILKKGTGQVVSEFAKQDTQT